MEFFRFTSRRTGKEEKPLPPPPRPLASFSRNSGA
ncbi:hypothetical protein ACP70R_026511 [Stipagrostis hirtigluma subsp. patula]